MSYVAQLLPDRTGAEALRKLMLKALIKPDEFELTEEESDSIHALYAKLSLDMRRKQL